MKQLIRHILREHIHNLYEMGGVQKWSLEKIQNIASQYQTKSDFAKNEPNAYASARYNGWLDIVTSHMVPQKESWTKEKLEKVASKYQHPGDFRKHDPNAYAAALRNGWLEELTKDMIKQHRKLSKPEIEKISMKFKNSQEWKDKDPGTYGYAQRHGWLEDITKDLPKQKRILTFDDVYKIAQNYKHRSDFEKGDRGAYYAAVNKGWLDEVCSHMTRLGNEFKRIVYVYEFPDNSVYVGLTLNKDRRNLSHMLSEDSPVYRYIKKTGLQPSLKYLSEEYLDTQDAVNLEICTIQFYKESNWNVLNTEKGGQLGTCRRIWTIERVKEIAKKFKTRGEMKINAKGAYSAAVSNKWLDEIFPHIPSNRTFLSKQEIIKIASNYNLVNDFKKDHGRLYKFAIKKGWWDEISKEIIKRQSQYVKSLVSDYVNFKELRQKNPGLFAILAKNKLFDSVKGNLKNNS
jgi:hypothetical protein